MAISQWRRLIQLWQRRSHQGWRPRHLLMLCVVGGTIASVMLLSTTSYQFVRGLILEQLKKNALLEVQLGVDQIDRWLGTHKAEIEAIANTPTLQTANWSAVEPYLQVEMERLEEFSALVWGNSDSVFYTTQTDSFDGTPKERDPFESVTLGQNIGVSDPFHSPTLEDPQIAVVAPVRCSELACESSNSEKPQQMGVVAGFISIDRVLEVVGNLEYGPGSYAFALNGVGTAIVHPDEGWVPTGTQAVPTLLRSPDPSWQRIARQMISKRSQIERLNLDGDWVYVAYLPLQEAQWSIALVIPSQNLESQLLQLDLLASVLGIVLAFATAAALKLVLSSEKMRALAAREGLRNRLTRRIHASLELDWVLQTTVEEVAALLCLDRAAFGWYDPQDRCLDLQWEYHQEKLPPGLGRFAVPPEFETQLQRGERIVLRAIDPKAETQMLELDANRYTARSVRSQSDRFGYLICIHPNHCVWDRSEKQLLESVAKQLAIAMTQSYLHTQTQMQVEQLDRALKEIEKTQTRLIHAEKMSGLGQLAAGIAHEINNPVNFIYGNLIHASEYAQNLINLADLYENKTKNIPKEAMEFKEEIEFDYIKKDLPSILKSMKAGADRIRKIVLSLRTFSHLDEADKKFIDIHEGLESTLMVLHHRIKENIEILKNFSYLPKVECYAAQMNQAFMYLINNAIEAIESSDNPRKVITLSTGAIPNPEQQSIYVSIADNGIGIPPEIQSRIFEPFFTTKPVGQATGLGLSIGYQIIVDLHGGQISVYSVPGKTEFILEIPVQIQ